LQFRIHLVHLKNHIFLYCTLYNSIVRIFHGIIATELAFFDTMNSFLSIDQINRQLAVVDL
jgi:hypothetical protein